ncbi:MAG: penicillin-binding protein [Acidimicrobiia bacterium]|nr:penicillin-binding protein [Acidimicrobiia bacterium]
MSPSRKEKTPRPLRLTTRRRRHPVLKGFAILAVLALVGGLGVAVVLRSGVISSTRKDTPESVTDDFLEAWEKGDWTAMRALAADPPPEMVPTLQAMMKDLDVGDASFRRGAAVPASPGRDVEFRARLDLRGLGRFSYTGSLHLVPHGDGWAVAWTPAAAHPKLTAGHRFAVKRKFAARAAILGARGVPLNQDAPAVTIGLHPERITDLAAVVKAFDEQLQVRPAETARLLAQPWVRPDTFVPIVTVARSRYEEVKPVIYPLPGVEFQESTQRGSGSPGLQAHVVGTTGPVTAEQLQELGAPYREGDTVGRRGLEEAFERRLAGSPSWSVTVVDAAGRNPVVLSSTPGAPPRDVTTTIDPTVQAAAEKVFAGVEAKAAVVALRASTGEVLAVASTPRDEPFNRALGGRYPPGSTFKVVTAAALLRDGTRAGQRVPCPSRVTIGGARFHNFEDTAHGTITFAEAFTRSCNTAFARLADGLPDGALDSEARRFGFGAKPALGLAAAGGRFPRPEDRAERAAAALGQGRVTASPLVMAGVAGAVASGTWHPPVLVTEPRPGGAGAGRPQELDPGVVRTLQGFMLSVVASPDGTGRAAAVPGPVPVAGKTGTAEFGTGRPPPTHAWFIGYRGDVAFAVVVEGGGVGGEVAAPLAARFLTALGT